MIAKQFQNVVRAAEAPFAFIVILILWEYGAGFIVPDYILPVPTVIITKFWQTLSIQVHHLGVTAATTMVGLAMALFIGVLLALSVIYIRPMKAIVMPILAAFNSIPKIAIAPLFVIWFGLGIEPKVLLAFLLGLFPVFVNSITGLGEIEPDVLDLAKLAGGNELRIFAKVRLMNAVPYITDAIKVAFPLALVGSIVGEFIGGNRGVGYLILSGQFNMDTPLVFATLLSITLFTTIVIGIVVILERLLLKWRPSRRKR
ncbi:MAG: ABC transporter permease [Deltaproteobacteria bacterium]|jgi:NitT/TauT family transport system permease protein|nr:ABC transporter permease [Deltaproteobacteria bacterium]